jgi:hypothetical protein
MHRGLQSQYEGPKANSGLSTRRMQEDVWMQLKESWLPSQKLLIHPAGWMGCFLFRGEEGPAWGRREARSGQGWRFQVGSGAGGHHGM